ncbi:MAG: PQQ-dependent sugar dehydrogenase [Anaerolineae bacterium]
MLGRAARCRKSGRMGCAIPGASASTAKPATCISAMWDREAGEEVDFQPAGDAGGENYGWNVYEATHPFSGAAAPADMVLPVAEYSHNEGISISGGYVYRGSLLPALNGVYFYGDYGTGTIWSLYRDASGNWQNSVFMRSTGNQISGFGEDEDGELYVVDYRGRILRFEPA